MSRPLQTLLRHFRRLTEATGPGALTDGQLLARFVAGRDEAAFEVLLWRHGAMVYDMCRRLLRSEQDAEDAFQATFLALARKAVSVRRGEALASWLYKVAYRIALAARTANAGRAAWQGDWSEIPERESAGWTVRNDLRPVLDEEIHRLPEKYRAAFVLCYLEGRTNEEAARQLGCPKGTILSRLARARARLRVRLTRRGLGVSASGLAAFVGGGGWADALPATLVGKTLTTAFTSDSVAAGRVATLTEGALRTMSMTKLKIVLGLLLVAGLMGAAAVGERVFAGGCEARQAEAVPEFGAARQAPEVDPRADDALQIAMRRRQSAENLKQIGQALNAHHDTHGHFPEPSIYDKKGKALLSWRVAILPFLDQKELYSRFRLNEPWDSLHNKKLLREMPNVYAPVGAANKEHGMTYYLAFVGPHAGFEAGKKLSILSFADGTDNTIWIAEAASPALWTKPEDLPFAADQPLPKLGGLFGGNFHALKVDGSVIFASKAVDQKHLRAVLLRDKLLGKDAIAPDGKMDRDRLSEDNERLFKLQVQLRGAVEGAKQQLEELKKKLTSVAADQKTARLLKEREDLQNNVHRLMQELDAMRAERARVEQMVDERVRKKE
jgi:RNA polymerase sigma factor (sigma-70 family)